MIRKHWEMTLITTTDKSEANIRELFVRKTHITIMNIIGEGILSVGIVILSLQNRVLSNEVL